MFVRATVAIVVVCLVGILFPRSEVDARGSGGLHGGGMSSFHMGAHIGQEHRGVNRDRRDMHETRARHDDSRHDERRGDRHFARWDLGHWHQSPGFGDNARSSSSFDGQWHVGSGVR
jgi:hypothetical protein